MPVGPRSVGLGVRVIPLGLAMAAYIGLGLTEGMVGVVWPRLSAEFTMSAQGQSYLTASFAIGFIAASLPHGRILRRFTPSDVLVAAAVFGFLGAVAIAVAQGAAWIVAGSFLLGLSGGSLDAALSSHASVHYPHQRVLLMHGGFGIGATLGPGFLTAMFAADHSWRVAYIVVAALQLGLLSAWVIDRQRWPSRSPSRSTRGASGPAPVPADPGASRARRVQLVVVLGIVAFFVYTGTELAVGNWANTLLLYRGLDPQWAGLASTGYFGALMVGRFALSAIAARFHPVAIVTVATVSALSFAVAFGLIGATAPAVGAVALFGIGFSLAGVFPSLVALTPSRVGVRRAPAVMGGQLAAASLGAAVMPGLVGWLVDHQSAAVIGPGTAVFALSLCFVHVATSAAARQPLLAGVAAHFVDHDQPRDRV